MTVRKYLKLEKKKTFVRFVRRRRLKFQLDQTLDESDMLVAKKEELAEELRTIEQEVGSLRSSQKS